MGTTSETTRERVVAVVEAVRVAVARLADEEGAVVKACRNAVASALVCLHPDANELQAVLAAADSEIADKAAEMPTRHARLARACSHVAYAAARLLRVTRAGQAKRPELQGVLDACDAAELALRVLP